MEDKYYVGRTEDVTARIERHRRGGATNWTTRFPPLPGHEALYFWKPLLSDEEEDVVVEGLMFERYKRHGFDVVRGGTFFHRILPEHRRRALVDKFRVRDERCFVCGDECHVSKNCPARRRAVAQWREEVERAKRAVEDPNPRMPWESDEDEDEETPGDAYKALDEGGGGAAGAGGAHGISNRAAVGEAARTHGAVDTREDAATDAETVKLIEMVA